VVPTTGASTRRRNGECLIRILMRIEAKLEDVLELLQEDDDAEEEADE
jgi:hypothetical protein